MMEELEMHDQGPMLIMGELNGDRECSPAIMKMTQQWGWSDIGAMVRIWGVGGGGHSRPDDLQGERCCKGKEERLHVCQRILTAIGSKVPRALFARVPDAPAVAIVVDYTSIGVMP